MSVPQGIPKGYNCGSKCSPGYYAAPSPSSWNTTLKECKECGKGYECPDGVNRNECLPGTFSSSSTGTNCTPCPVGSTTSGTSPYTDTSRCSACIMGYEYKENNCSKCPAGTYGGGGRNLCQKCDKNSYSTIGASSCTRCMNDDITWSLASTKISDCHSTCPTGLGPFPQCNKAIAGYQLSTKAPTGNALFRDTEKCPVGHFQSELSDSPCAPCPVGSYAGSEGSTSCTKCPTSAKYTKSAGTTSESGCYDVPPDCSANGVDARSCLFGAWGPQSFGEKWKLFENYGASLTPTGTPSYTPDEIYKKFDSIQKEAVTSECSASTCKTPGQLCQVPGKNIYSCCVPYLTQEQWKKYYSKNGFGIDEYYQATNGQFKWASILPGGCLNNPYGSDSSNPLQSWSMGTLNDTGIPSEKNGIIPSALAMGWGEYSEGYETGTYTGKCPAAPPGIFASGGSFITNYRCKPSLSLAAGAPGGGFAGGTGSTVGHWSQGGKYWGNGNFPGYGLQITETNPNYSNPDSEAFEHTIHNRQVCAQFAEPVRQVGFQGGMKNRAGEMIGHPGSWFKSNGNCKGDSYSMGCNRQFQSAQTCCVPTLVLDGTGGSCDSSGKTPSYYVDT